MVFYPVAIIFITILVFHNGLPLPVAPLKIARFHITKVQARICTEKFFTSFDGLDEKFITFFARLDVF